jgi:hypothetical protein
MRLGDALWKLLQGHISRLVARHAAAHIIAMNGH